MSTNQNQFSFYSFFTKYSLMEDYGFGSGLFYRLFRKILPKVPEVNTIEYQLLKSNNSVEHTLNLLDLKTIKEGTILAELDLSIKALGAKIVAFGLDNNIKSKLDFLQLDSKPFEDLFDQLNSSSFSNRDENFEILGALEAAQNLIIQLRKNKNKIGTSFHLTVITRRILEYIRQVQKLLDLEIHVDSEKHWKQMFNSFIVHTKQKNSLSRFFIRHSDLVALEIVEHTSNKGEKYIAESKKEFWGFFYKSLLGGGIISIFALIKIVMDSYNLSSSQNAVLFSLNYAICFILVKQFGGIIATKQPAVTASRIAKGIDGEDDLKIDSIQKITQLIRKVIRSQFISIIGNFLMALSFACLISFLFSFFKMNGVIESINPKYLIKNTLPTGSLIFFAAVAGVFLALSGLVSGYVDNKVVASQFGHRIRNSLFFFNSKRLAFFVEKKAGSLIGNICLGFLLGSIFLLSSVLPFDIDIRHIAFSSANVGYGIMNYHFGFQLILLAIAGTLLIGFVNFAVSFSITLILALKSRGASLRFLPNLLVHVAKDFIKNPIDYFIHRNEN